MALSEPIGFNEEDARQYLGCTPGMFEELRARKIIKPIRRGWYSKEDLYDAMQSLRKKPESNVLHLPKRGKTGDMKTPREFLA